jgi:hypothetical protein
MQKSIAAGLADVLGEVALEADALNEIELGLGPVDAVFRFDDHPLHEVAASGIADFETEFDARVVGRDALRLEREAKPFAQELRAVRDNVSDAGNQGRILADEKVSD